MEDFNVVSDISFNEQPLGDYTRVTYRIKIRRRSGFFVANVILPSILINYLSLASFLIPTSSDENIGFSVTIFLAQTVNLMSTSQFIPNGGIGLPVWGIYLVASIFHLTVIVLLNIKLTSLRNKLNWNNNCDESAVKFVKAPEKIFADCFTCCCKNRKNVEPVVQEKVLNDHQKERNIEDSSQEATTKLQKLEVIKKALLIVDFIGLTIWTATTLIIMKS